MKNEFPVIKAVELFFKSLTMTKSEAKFCAGCLWLWVVGITFTAVLFWLGVKP